MCFIKFFFQAIERIDRKSNEKETRYRGAIFRHPEGKTGANEENERVRRERSKDGSGKIEIEGAPYRVVVRVR